MGRRLLLLAAAASGARAFSSYRSNFPNSHRVPCPDGVGGCINGLCEGVGHASCTGGTLPANGFGADFRSTGGDWSKLCSMDSDGDGQTNGQELGDPCCKWAPGAQWASLDDYEVSHPGATISFSLNPGASDAESCSQFAVPENDSHPIFYPSETQRMHEYVPSAYDVPTETNSYTDVYYEIPMDDVYHVVGFEVIVDNGELLHHFVLYGCEDPVPSGVEEGVAYRQGLKRDMVFCDEMLWAWAPGSVVTSFPEVAGFRCGPGTKCQSLMLDVHYGNPTNVAGQTDRSGFRMYTTPDLRKHDLGVLWTGSIIALKYAIPNQSDMGGRRFFDSVACELAGDGKDITVVDYLVHAHLLGRGIWSEQFRRSDADSEPEYFDGLGSDQNFNFYNQMYRPFADPKVVRSKKGSERGDVITTTCLYSSDRDEAARGGVGTWDEMCINFLVYYPAEDGAANCVPTAHAGGFIDEEAVPLDTPRRSMALLENEDKLNNCGQSGKCSMNGRREESSWSSAGSVSGDETDTKSPASSPRPACGMAVAATALLVALNI